MSLNLYDLLDVDESATAEEIRGAWKAAIEDLTPADRRFRAYNDAAEVLLGEEERAEYDATLAAERAEDIEDAEAGPAEPDEAEPEEAEPAAATERPAPAVPAWALLAAAVAAVLSLALLVWVLTWPGSLGGESPKDRAAAVDTAAGEVEGAATEMVPVVFSYDHRTFDADVERAEAYFTPEFGEQRASLLADLKPEVTGQRVSVVAAVSGSGVTRISEDGQRAQVVVFIDQSSRKGRSEPELLRLWATLYLVREGGEWLLEDICTLGERC
jgi:Mce-associated membrane protein